VQVGVKTRSKCKVFARAVRIYKKEGLKELALRITTLPARRQWLTTKHEVRYIYEITLKEREAKGFMPRMRDYILRWVSTNQQADMLEADGYELRSIQPIESKGLDIGAIACCMFVGRELVNIGWVALTPEAKSYIDRYKYQVDFANKEVCTGSFFTVRKYQGKGLFKYGAYEIHEYLRKMGMERIKTSVEIHNIPSQKLHARFQARICAKVSYLRFLGHEFWRQSKLDSTL